MASAFLETAPDVALTVLIVDCESDISSPVFDMVFEV
jgi:hypothetical protein